MADHRASSPRSSDSRMPPGDSLATPRERCGALSLVALLFIVATYAAVNLGRTPGPVFEPFIAITATIWSLADTLTAFLLLTQFAISGRYFFAISSLAYGFNGLLTWGFIAVFPGLFSHGPFPVAVEQPPSYLWLLWHCTFPILIMCAVATGASVERVASGRTIRVLTILLVALPVLAAAAITALAIAFRGALPQLVEHGQMQPLYRFVLLPIAVALNACAAFALLRTRTLTPLRLWLAVATVSACLDVVLLDIGSARFSYLFDVGKLVTVFSGSIVLVMLMCDVIGMYGRLARVERIDVLTSLRTRFAFEEHLRSLFQLARRRPTSLGLLLIAVDSFERYNDAHGAGAGEEALRRIARELLVCAPRPADFVARYGDREFVVLLPGLPLENVRLTAERIRAIVAGLRIVRGRADLGRVTVSIGIGYASDAFGTDERSLFDAADLALENAIARGCNCVVTRSIDAVPAEGEPVVRLALDAGPVLRR